MNYSTKWFAKKNNKTRIEFNNEFKRQKKNYKLNIK